MFMVKQSGLRRHDGLSGAVNAQDYFTNAIRSGPVAEDAYVEPRDALVETRLLRAGREARAGRRRGG
jgi:hypothetical protein